MDNSATSYPKPKIVNRKVREACRKYFANPGRSTSPNATKTSLAVFEARESLARLVGTVPENIVFTYNATYALNMAIFGMIKPNMTVAVDAFAHNSVMRPLYYLSSLGAKLHVLETDMKRDSVIINALEKLALFDKPDVVVLTHTSNVTGKTLPLKRLADICKKNKIKLIVDASQSLGSHKINMRELGIDALASSGHKGLYGITGSGFLAFGDMSAGDIEPLVKGGSGIFSLEKTMPSYLPERLEAGTLGIPSIMSMKAGADFIMKIGEEKIGEHERKLRNYLVDGLLSISGVKVYNADVASNSVVLFNMNSLPSEILADKLSKMGISGRAGYHCAPTAHEILGTIGGEHNGAMRLSVGYFNTKRECESTLTSICKLSKEI